MKYWGTSLLAFFLFVPSLFAQPIQEKNGISYSNIAPGEFENKDLNAFPLKVVFKSESDAPYGGVFVRIFNASGIAVFKNLCEKPWLYVRLPEGDYNLIAVDRKKVQRIKPFQIKGGKKQNVVTLTWPVEAVGY